MPKPRPDAPVQDEPPAGERVTDYDRLHLLTYARLLDAAGDPGATWKDAARIVLRLDVEGDPARARRVHDAHLARARWMTELGYRDLLPGGRPGET